MLAAHLKCQATGVKTMAVLHDFNYVAFWKRQNNGDSEKISDCQGCGGEREKDE